jgi:8-oxo-dGTP diphosphatase
MKLATLCYLRDSGKTLMLLRNKKVNDIHDGKWNGLGGKFNPGETPEECARREVEEESGYQLREIRLKGFIVFPAFDGIEDWYVFVFTSDDFSGDLRDSTEGSLAWIDNSELLNLHLWEGDHIFMPWLDQPQLFSARFNYQNKKLVDYQVSFYE